VKFALGWTSLVFDAIFVVQHWAWMQEHPGVGRAAVAEAAMQADLHNKEMCFGNVNGEGGSGS